MGVGRTKNQIQRKEHLHLRLTEFELEKISRVAKKNFLREPMQFCAILICSNATSKKIQKYHRKNPKQSSMLISEEVVMFDK